MIENKFQSGRQASGQRPFPLIRTLIPPPPPAIPSVESVKSVVKSPDSAKYDLACQLLTCRPVPLSTAEWDRAGLMRRAVVLRRCTPNPRTHPNLIGPRKYNSPPPIIGQIGK